jgi:phosphoglycolate phosphatase
VGPGELDELEKAFRAVYDGGAWKMAALFPEVGETLAALVDRGSRLFVITNKPRVPAERILAHLGVLPLLAAVYSPDHRQPAFKTKAEALSQLQADWCIDCERMLLVGDSTDDAHAAASSGCQFAGVEYGYGMACSQMEYPVHLKLRAFGELILILTGNLSAIP